MVLKSVIFRISPSALSKEGFAVLWPGRQCRKFQAVHYSDKLLACALFVAFAARLLCMQRTVLQSARDRHSASILCVYLGYYFAGQEHMTSELLLQLLIGSLTL